MLLWLSSESISLSTSVGINLLRIGILSEVINNRVCSKLIVLLGLWRWECLLGCVGGVSHGTCANVDMRSSPLNNILLLRQSVLLIKRWNVELLLWSFKSYWVTLLSISWSHYYPWNSIFPFFFFLLLNSHLFSPLLQMFLNILNEVFVILNTGLNC
jgi:hypothetical protein